MTSVPQQLLIRFPQIALEFDGLAVTPANQAAITAVRQVQSWPCHAFCLSGPTRSGLSTIARAFAHERGGQYIPAEGLSGLSIDQIEDLLVRDIAIDRADKLTCSPVLLAVLDAADRRGRHILLTAQTVPAAWSTDSPDLASRLKALPVIQLSQPDEALMRARLQRACQCAYLDMPAPVEDYLIVRLGLDYSCIDSTVDALAALAANRALTIPLVRTILSKTGLAPDPLEGV